MKKDTPYILLQLLFCALLVALTTIFYMTPLRRLIEDKFFDIKARLSLNQQGQDKVLVINLPIAPRAFEDLDSHAIKLQEASAQIFQVLAQSDAKAYIFFAFPQFLDQEHLMHQSWLWNLRDDPRMFLASFQSDTSPPLLTSSPFFGYADLIRTFRRTVVRDYYIKHPSLKPLIAEKVVNYLQSLQPSPDSRPIPDSFFINYIPITRLTTLSASQFLDMKGNANQLLQNKVVIVGVDAYAPFTFAVREATYANSPWQGDGDQLDRGVPNHYIHAIATSNLINGSWLEKAPLTVQVLQTLLFCAILLYSWRFSAGVATSTFIGCWLFTIAMHLVLAQTLYIHIPLADTAWFSSFALMGGAMARLRKETLMSLAQEARLQKRKHSDHTQDRFLEHFATVLAQINQETKKILNNTPLASHGKGSLHDLFDKAMASSEELDDYLKGMRQFAGVQTSSLSSLQPKITFQPCNIEALVASVSKQFEARCKEKNVNLQVACVANTRPVMINTDPTLLSQILFNLISNAVKYSPEGGLVTVDIVQRHLKSINISVSDQGPGIDSEYHEKIFEKFYRVKDDLVFKVKGHGLGLYLSGYFIRLLNGTITIKSAKNHGSLFTIHLGDDL